MRDRTNKVIILNSYYFCYNVFFSVRSLASVALRKALNSRPGFHFDYFTVDLNNEFSGLNGALLYEQSRYVNLSIKRILQLYENNKHQPKSLILIGHSMVDSTSMDICGGLVIVLFLGWNYSTKCIIF